MATARTWQQELEIIDRTMKAISGVMDPQKLVDLYWKGLGDLHPVVDYVVLSRRHVPPPEYLVTRSSRFTEDYNPWTQRHRLPRLAGGILGELAYAEKPIFIDDLSVRLTRDDPGWFYLQGFERLISLPQYDGGKALNVSIMLLTPGMAFDPAQIPSMHWHSSLFGRGTQTLVLRNQLADALATLDRELEAVGQIQRTLLPESLPEIPGFEFAAFYQTSARAGGDYYDFFNLAGGELGLFIADVSGHGTPAAVLMAITHALAHSQPASHTPPGALLAQLNRQLMQAYLRDGMFVTAFYAVLNPARGTLTYARAGHNPPRLVRDQQILPLDVIGSLPMGIDEHETYEENVITLQPDDLLLLYTDGITEAMTPLDKNGKRELFGQDRLDQVLLAACSSPPRDCLDQLRAQINHFTQGSPPVDDQTLIAIRCK